MVTSDLETVLGLFLPRTERHRTKLLKPKFCDGYAYATDGNMFVRVSQVSRNQVDRPPETEEEIALCKSIDEICVAVNAGEKLYDTKDMIPRELIAAAAAATVESSARSSRRLFEYGIEIDEYAGEVEEHALVEFEIENDRSSRPAMYAAYRIRAIAEAMMVCSSCGLNVEMRIVVQKSNHMLYVRYGDLEIGLMSKYFDFTDDRKRYAVAAFGQDEIMTLHKCKED